ncbi:hypothetical protein CTAYLR_010669 [Chrysophaeum taylorii]|uniref:LamG-like jellyroll fold domain-containing protein n=1 Tax=Chrysophaeum taylorii TaxID=2483200 RepID=A0AAD7U7W9_9STRA|nr:hypothetical protein CTAYLR_010669 [Chrysophaeum taylorii]
MFSAMNCFSRARVQALGGEMVLILSSDSPDASLVGAATWEEGYGPTSAVAALNLSRGGSAVEILEGEGVVLSGECYSLTAWVELPLGCPGTERTLAACGAEATAPESSSRSAIDEILEDEDEEVAVVCVSASGELGVRASQIEGFSGCGLFVDDLKAGWYHVAAVADNNATSFWINGRPVGNAKAQVSQGSRLRRLGSRVPASRSKRALLDECWGGRIADARVFGRALDADDLAIVFGGGALAAAAANAPALPPKHERVQRAARARLVEAARLVDDSLQLLDAARDLVVSSCVEALPDLAGLVEAFDSHRATMEKVTRDACAPHGLDPTFSRASPASPPDLRDLVDPSCLDDGAPVFVLYFPPPGNGEGTDRDLLATLRCPVIPADPADDNLPTPLRPRSLPAAVVCATETGHLITDDALSDLDRLGPNAALQAWANLVPQTS